eukprot:scaffold65491_cov20-Tisochrysis_lutea.AAC.4
MRQIGGRASVYIACIQGVGQALEPPEESTVKVINPLGVPNQAPGSHFDCAPVLPFWIFKNPDVMSHP